MSKFDNVVGVVGAAVGLIGVGYALATRSKMAKISENLERSIDDLASRTPVDIPASMIERATEKAVAAEVKLAVSKATDAAMAEIKRDVHKQVSDAVEGEYSTLKETVLKELTDEASKIDMKRVRSDVEAAAKKIAIEKFDDNLDDILKGFSENLENTSKIYKSIADTMSKSSEHSGTVLRIG
jgi:hypothetical protein